MDMSIINIGLTFGAGILSVFSPCILPIIPVIVAGSEKDSKFRPAVLVAGLALTFVVMGIVTAAFSSLIMGKIYYLEKGVGVIIVLFGLAMFFNINPFKTLTIFNRLSGIRGKGLLSGFILGATLGLIWIPCIGPILSGILAMVAAQRSVSSGIALLSVYSIGFSIPIIIAAYFSHFFRTRLGFFREHPLIIRFASGTILLLLGTYIFFKGMVGFTL